MNKTYLFAIFFIAVMSSSKVLSQSNVSIEDLWINEAPPNMTVLAAYGSIHNQSDSELILEKITSPQFSTIEIHKVIVNDDVSKMLKQDVLPISKGTATNFSPGGAHMMLYDPVSPVRKGDSFIFTFYFSDGSQVEANALVKKRSETSDGHHHHHNHQH